MRLLFVRHGKAGEREEWMGEGKPDELRPLTKKGIEEFQIVAKHLAKHDKDFDKIFSSPLVRTVQTAEILRDHFELKIEERAELKYTSEPEDLLIFLKSLKPDGSYILVGHDPTLGQFATWMLSGKLDLFIDFKKGAALLMTSTREPAPGEFQLEFLLPPKLIL